MPALAPDALELLQRYVFPGNVRELENLLHRALALSGAQLIARGDLDLPDDWIDEGATVEADAAAGGAPAPVAALAAPVATEAALPADLAAYLDQVEREILERALERFRYNRTAAGASLGLSLRQMRYRMARLGVGAVDHDAG